MSTVEREKIIRRILLTLHRPNSEVEHQADKNKAFKRMLDKVRKLEGKYNFASSVLKISFGQDAGDRKKFETAQDKYEEAMRKFALWLETNESSVFEIVITPNAQRAISQSPENINGGALKRFQNSVKTAPFDMKLQGYVIRLGDDFRLSVRNNGLRSLAIFRVGSGVAFFKPSEIKAIRVAVAE